MKTKWGYTDAEKTVLHFDIQRENELFHGWSDKKFGESDGLDYFVNNYNGVDMVIVLCSR